MTQEQHKAAVKMLRDKAKEILNDPEYEKIRCPQCDGSGYIHAYDDGRVIASCCDEEIEKQ